MLDKPVIMATTNKAYILNSSISDFSSLSIIAHVSCYLFEISFIEIFCALNKKVLGTGFLVLDSRGLISQIPVPSTQQIIYYYYLFIFITFLTCVMLSIIISTKNTPCGAPVKFISCENLPDVIFPFHSQSFCPGVLVIWMFTCLFVMPYTSKVNLPGVGLGKIFMLLMKSIFFIPVVVTTVRAAMLLVALLPEQFVTQQ